MSNGSINYDISASTTAATAALAKLGAAFGKVTAAGKGAFGALTAPVGGFIKGLGAMNQALEGIGQLMRPVLAIKDGLVAASQAAADFEASKVAFEVLAGGAEKGARVLREIRDLANATPFEFPELAEAGQLLMNFGTSAEQVAGTLRKLGDVSAVRKNLGQVAMIFGQVQAKTKLTGEELLQFAEAGVPMLKELARMLKTDEARVTDLVSAGMVGFPLVEKAMGNLTDKGGQFYQMMQKQSATTKGLLSTLGDAWTEVKVALGEPVNDALRPVLRDLISWVGDLGPKVREIGDQFRDWAVYIRNAFKGGFGWEALVAPLKLYLLDAANAFSAGMMATVNMAVQMIELAKGGLEHALTGNYSVRLKNPAEQAGGLLNGEIAAVKNRMAAMDKEAAFLARLQGTVDEFAAAADAAVAKSAEIFSGAADGGKAYEKALAAAQGALNDPGGKRLAAMLKYQRELGVAELKLRGLNKEAAKLEREQKVREKIAEIVKDTGASYAEAAAAARKLVVAEEGPRKRLTPDERREARRAASQEGRDMRREVARLEREERKRAAADPFAGLNARKRPGSLRDFSAPGLDWLKKGQKAVDKALEKPREAKPAQSPEVAAINALKDMLDRKLAVV